MLAQTNHHEGGFEPKQKATAQNAERPQPHSLQVPHQLLSPVFCCHLRKGQRTRVRRGCLLPAQPFRASDTTEDYCLQGTDGEQDS